MVVMSKTVMVVDAESAQTEEFRIRDGVLGVVGGGRNSRGKNMYLYSCSLWMWCEQSCVQRIVC